MRKVTIVDSFCSANMHEQFNASLLLMLSSIYPETTYYSGKENRLSIQFLCKEKDLRHISFRSLWIIGGSGKISLMLRYIISLFYNCFFLLTTSKDEVLIFNYNNAFALASMNMLNKFLGKKVLIFCHGELELLVDTGTEVGILHKLLTYFLRSFFFERKTQLSAGLYFAVTGDSIFLNLSKILDDKTMLRFISCDHAYLFDKSRNDSISANKELYLGWIGVFNTVKGGTNLLQIADQLDLRANRNIQLSITGRIFYDIQVLLDRGIRLPHNKGLAMLSREEFNKSISVLDYILFLYPVGTYAFTASGAIMDAIDRRIPILALKNDYFNYIFSKYGSIGYLADTVDELVDMIEHLEKDKSFLPFPNFDEIQHKLSCETIAIALRQQLCMINYI